MGWTEAQQAAINRALGRAGGRTNEEEEEAVETPSLEERQRAAVESAMRRYAERSGLPEEPEGGGPGLLGAVGNLAVRTGGRAVGLTDAYQAERLAEAARVQEEMSRREAAGEMSLLDRIATWRPSWAAPLETPDELRGLAGDRVVAQAQRDQRLAEQFPMSERGARGVRSLSEVESFSEGLGVIANQPLDVLAGALEVGAEQAPFLAAAAAATVATRNPGVGMGVMGASTYAQERFGQMSAVAQEFGYDLTNPAQARAAVRDEEFMRAQEERGMTRGAVIAAVDALTFRAGAAIFQPNLRGLAGNAALQVGGGAAGEALAQYASEGEISAPGEVLLEGLAEGPFSVVELAMGRTGRGKPTPTGTDLDAELAAEEAQLAADARRQQEEQAAAQDVEVRTTRLDYAPTFVSEKDFAAQQQEAVRRDAVDPNTETGQAYRQYLLDNDILPTNPQEETSAVNAFVKQTVGAQDAGTVAQQYRAALDEHIGRMRDLETLLTADPNAEQQLELDLADPNAETAPEAAPAEGAPATENQDGQLEMDLAPAEEATPQAPDPARLATELVKATGVAVDDRVAADISARMQQIIELPVADRVAAARALVANYTTPQKKAAAKKTDAASQKPAEPTAARVPPPITMETPVRRRTEAQAKADALLPANWTEDARYDNVNSALNGTKFNIKKFNTALEAALNPQQETQAAPEAEAAPETGTDAAPTTTTGEARRALIAEANQRLGPDWATTHPDIMEMIGRDRLKSAADRIAEVAPVEETQSAADTDADTNLPATPDNAATDMVEAAALPSVVENANLSGNEQKVFKVLMEAFQNNEQDAVMQADGSWNTAEIGKRAGVGAKTANTYISRSVNKIAKSLGVTPDQMRERLRQTGKERRQGEAAPAFDAPTVVLDVAELGDSVGTKASANQGARDGMSKEDIEYMENRSKEPDAYENKRQEIADRERLADTVRMVKTYGRMAIQMWQNISSGGAVRVQDLSPNDMREWLGAVEEHAVGEITYDQLVADQREMERRYDANQDGVTMEDIDGQEAIEGTTAGGGTNVDGVSGAGTPESQGGGNEAQQVRGADTGAPRGETGQADTGVVGEARAAPTVEVRRKRNLVNRPKFSNIKLGVGTEADIDPLLLSTPESMANVVFDLTGKDTHPRIHVFETEADLIAAVENGSVPSMTTDDIRARRPYGFVMEDDNGDAHAFFITNRIPAGGELAAFMHEVGSHVGLDRMLSEGQLEALYDRIAQWSERDDNSTESALAKKALARYAAGRARGAYTDADLGPEVLAYFIEEAVHAGITPSVQTPVGRLLRDLYAAFKRALRKLNLVDSEKLTAQNLVDLAYGAARLDLSTRKHGTAADFRRFNHSYMGSGEGNQAFGFGTYLADRFSIARSYLRAMEAKTPGEKIRDSAPVSELPGISEKLQTPGLRRYDRLTGRAGPPLRPPQVEVVRSAGAQIVLAPNGPAIAPGANSPSGLTLTLHSLADADGNPLFTNREIAQARSLLVRREEGNLMRVDTTVSDDEMVNWFRDLRSDDGQRILALLETLDADTQAAINENLARYVATKQAVNAPGLNTRGRFDGLYRTASEADWNEMVLDTTVGELYKILSGSAVSRRLADRISPEAFAKVKDFKSQFMMNDAIVSAFFDENGIKGIIYEDANSRGVDAEQRMYNRVIFNEDNMIVVGRTPGRSVSDSQNKVSEIKFGLARDWAEKNFGGPATAQFLGNTRVAFQDPLNATKFLSRFIRDVAETMPSAKAWYDNMLAAEQTRNDILGRVEPIIVRARQLAPERYAAVNDFIGKSTFYQKWGYDPKWKGRTVKVDPVMKAAFERFSADEQQIVKDVFQHGEDMRQMMQTIAKQRGVAKMFTFDSKLTGPYAPLKRFGNYAGELKSQQLLDAEKLADKQPSKINRDRVEKLKSDPDHYVISFFDTLGAAEKFANENSPNYAFTEASKRAPDINEGRIGNPQVFEKVIAALRADQKSGLDKQTRAAVENLVKNLYFESLEEGNARLAGARRLNRAGYDKDMMRSFVSHARAQANLISQMKHGAEINEAFVKAGNEARKDRRNLQPVYNVIARKYQNVLTPRTGFVNSVQDHILAFNTVYMLTSSIGYHVTNATQPIVSVAKIAGDFGGYAKTWGKLISGYKVASNVINGSLLRQLGTATTVGFVDLNNKVDVDVSKAPPEYRQLLQTMQLRKLLDVGVEEDLNLEDRFDTGYETLNKASDAFRGITHRLYQVARYVEAANRVSSAVAAYDMALANRPMLQKLKLSPEEYAIAVVEDTQGNFTNLDAPLVIDSLPRVTTQYRKFQLMMAWLYGSAFKQAFRGESPELRAAGQRTMGYLLAHTALLSGATGIPFATTLVPLFLAMASEGDEPEDLERWIRDNIEDERMADLISRGVPAFFGVDMSTKLTNADIFLPYNPNYVSPEATPDGALSFVASVGLGPTSTTIKNFGSAAEFLSKGDPFRAVEYLTPRGVRSAMESYRFATDGYSLRNGDVILDPRDVDIGSLLSNAIGLPSTEINRIKWTRGQQYELDQWFSGESGRIRSDYVEAYQSRDRETMSALRREWRDLQDAKDRVRPFFNNARSAPQRQPVTDLLRAPREQGRREDRYREALGTN